MAKHQMDNSVVVIIINNQSFAFDTLPWVPEVFLACGRNLQCRPKADRSSAFRAGHYKDLTETGNRARKVSGTQGIDTSASL